MSQSLESPVLALAAIAQSIGQVQSIARTNKIDEEVVTPLIKSVFNLSPDSVEDLYLGTGNLHIGLQSLKNQMSSQSGRGDPEFGRYLANILSVHKQFMKRNDLQKILFERIEHTTRLLDYESLLSSAIFSSLADAYSQTISTLSVRIQVHGEPEFLNGTANQNKVRAILLAAVRAAVIWGQIGGKKRHFIFQRKAMIQTIDRLLLRE